MSKREMTNQSDDPLSRINMQGIHVELTAALQRNIREKFSVLLRHNERIVRIHVRLHQDQVLGRKALYTATAQVELRGPDIVATVKGDDAYNLLDELVKRVDEQLKARHERLTDERKHPHGVELGAPLPKAAPR